MADHLEIEQKFDADQDFERPDFAAVTAGVTAAAAVLHHLSATYFDTADGRLQAVAQVPSGGRTPRGFCLDPEGRWLLAANQDTNNVAVFSLDPATGIPAPTGQSLEVRSAVCVQFLPQPR